MNENQLEFNHKTILNALLFHKQSVAKVKQYGNDLVDIIRESTLMEKRENHINYLFRLCNEVKEKFTIFVCGEVNAGKSLFISEFLKGKVDLPSNDEPCTCRITRIKYHHSDVIRKGMLIDGELQIFQEEELTDDFDLESWISLETKDRYKHEEVSIVVEIGLDLKILSEGLQLVDCPGLGENKTISEVELSLLNIMRPNLILYIYDSRRTFNENICETLQRIERVLKDSDVKSPEHTQYIILANKIDIDMAASRRDRRQDTQKAVSLKELNAKLISEATKSIKKYFPDDFKEKLPIFPISTRKLCEYRIDRDDNGGDERSSPHTDEQEDYFIECLNDLTDKLCHKIRDMSRKIACCFSYWIHVDLKDFETLDGITELKNAFIDKWFNIKSLEVNHSLKELMNNRSKLKKLVEFNDGYTVRGAKFENSYIHLTILSRNKTTERKFTQDKEHIYNIDFRPYTIVYTSDVADNIIIGKFDCSERRLMDELCNLNFDQVHEYIKHFVQYNGMLIRFKHKIIKDIRPDNLYLADKKIRNNKDVPVRVDSQLILKDQFPAEPFYLKSYWLKRSTCVVKDSLQDYESDEIFYRFGWIIWIMLEGSGAATPRGETPQQWIDQLKEGRFAHEKRVDILKNLQDVMKICWEVTQDSISASWEKVKAIVGFVPVDEWLCIETDKVEPGLKRAAENASNIIVDFKEGYEILVCDYKGNPIQITRLSSKKCENRIIDYRVEMLRIHEMFQREPGKIFQSEDKTRIYIIQFEAPSKRLLDILPELDESDVVKYIEQIVNDLSEKFTLFNPLWPFFKKKNFRPDNIYVNDNTKRIYMNYNVPAHPDIPLILLGGRETRAYYLHMREKSSATETTYPEITGNQFVHRFGWVVWILLEGSGVKESPSGDDIDSWLNDLENSRFGSYPDYLKEVMQICWTVCDNSWWEDSWVRVKDLVEKNSVTSDPLYRK